jgi:site-specific DNA recombinase
MRPATLHRSPGVEPASVNELTAAAVCPEASVPGQDQAQAKLAECDRKLAQYRAALDAGGDPSVVARWITETETERARYQAQKRPAPPRASMTRQEITALVSAPADILANLGDAEPADKAEIYTQFGIRLIYRPQSRTVRAEASLNAAYHWQFEGVRGPSAPISQCVLSGEFALGSAA